MTADQLTAVAAVLVALTSFVNAVAGIVGRRRLGVKVDDVHSEVKTSNGRTLAVLAERAEGHRVAGIAAGARTVEEQGFVDRLTDGPRR